MTGKVVILKIFFSLKERRFLLRNLNAALGAYYDYGSPNTIGMPPPEYTTRLPSMQFVQDITIGEVLLFKGFDYLSSRIGENFYQLM